MEWKLQFISEQDFADYVRDNVEVFHYVGNDRLTRFNKGHFEMGIFQYMEGCYVPKCEEDSRWGVIFKKDSGIILPDGDVVHTVYAELKNKRRTMNSLEAIHSYLKMQSQLLDDDDCACFLVETDAKRSQNIRWAVTVDGKRISHNRIRLTSLDQFYALVTGQEDALRQLYIELGRVNVSPHLSR